jgi:hypothetical protein
MMSVKEDYVPDNDRVLLTWATNMGVEVETHAGLWNINPTVWQQRVAPKIQKYEAALTKAENPNHGKADTLAKNIAKKELIEAIRKFVKEFLTANSEITDDDRIRIGITVPKKTRKKAEKPKSVPNPAAKIKSAGVIVVEVTDSESGKKAKPDLVQGFEFVYAFSETPVSNWDDLNHSLFSTKTTLEVVCPADKRGKIMYFATRWENTRGEKGNWSDIGNIMIP